MKASSSEVRHGPDDSRGARPEGRRARRQIVKTKRRVLSAERARPRADPGDLVAERAELGKLQGLAATASVAEVAQARPSSATRRSGTLRGEPRRSLRDHPADLRTARRTRTSRRSNLKRRSRRASRPTKQPGTHQEVARTRSDVKRARDGRRNAPERDRRPRSPQRETKPKAGIDAKTQYAPRRRPARRGQGHDLVELRTVAEEPAELPQRDPSSPAAPQPMTFRKDEEVARVVVPRGADAATAADGLAAAPAPGPCRGASAGPKATRPTARPSRSPTSSTARTLRRARR